MNVSLLFLKDKHLSLSNSLNFTYIHSRFCSKENVVGYLSVYRIQFSLACFFFLMMILMLFVKRSKDPRSGIQNG